MALSVGVALGGILLARQFYLLDPALPERLMNRFRGLYITLLNKYWVDEIYDTLIVQPVKQCTKIADAGGVWAIFDHCQG